MKRVLFIHRTIFIFAVCVMAACSTQNIAVQEAKDNSQETELKSFYVDDLNNVYLINNEDELLKYHTDTDEELRFSNERLGSIHTVDVKNPLKLIVFYKDYQVIEILDNLLTEISRINLYDTGLLDISTVARSNDNKIWIYDPSDYKLKKIDNEGKVVLESITLYNEGLEKLNPSFCTEVNNQVFLYDESVGFVLFDNFGQFIEKIQLPKLGAFQIVKGKILYYQENNLYGYDLKFKNSEVIPIDREIPINEYQKFLIQENHIYMIKEGKLERYSL